ncbi:MAG: selenide, water dikinase SelD [Rhodospirillales bacterium]|nr:selenide, water dikinase SelD [Rhodospirillales bacterium]
MKQSLENVRLTEWATGAGCAAKMCSRDLSEILASLPKSQDPNLLVGLETSDDAGVYKISDDLALVDTVDFFPPMVDDPFHFGQIAAANALSDVYAMGARPVTALNLVGFPVDDLDGQVLQEIIRGSKSKLDEAGVALVGGHSIVDKEVKYGLSITGLVDPAKAVTNGGAKTGDSLIFTKPIGVGIINTAVKRGGADPAMVTAAIASMTQLNKAASECMLDAGVQACTDVTGFGLLGHAQEMAKASGVSLELDHTAIFTVPGSLELCADGFKPGGLENNRLSFADVVNISPEISGAFEDLLFDPQTSGGLLIAVAEKAAVGLLEKINGAQEMQASIIGRVTPGNDCAPLVTVS